MFRRDRDGERAVPGDAEDQYLTADDATVLAASFTVDGRLQPEQPAPVLEPHPEPPAGGRGYVARAEVTPHLERLAQLAADRAKLVEICLYARDRVNSRAAADRIDAGLGELGVIPVRADGEPFDPARHEASASVPTDNPALHGLVAETELPGYADGGVLVRPPVVTVYRREGGPCGDSE